MHLHNPSNLFSCQNFQLFFIKASGNISIIIWGTEFSISAISARRRCRSNRSNLQNVRANSALALNKIRCRVCLRG